MILRSQHGSGDRHRAFIAIEVPRRTVPENILEEIGSIGQLRPVRTPSFHLTLHFLGDMEIPALKSVTENISTVKFPPFQASLCGMGAFPRPADARVGITDFAQKQLTDIVFIDLPKKGTKLKAGSVLLTIESVKSAEDVYSPLDGEIADVNAELENKPELVNLDPYSNWMVKMKKTGNDGPTMSADEYRKFIGE